VPIQLQEFPRLSVPKLLFPMRVELQLLPSLAVPNVELPMVVWLHVEPVRELLPKVVFPIVLYVLPSEQVVIVPNVVQDACAEALITSVERAITKYFIFGPSFVGYWIGHTSF